MGLLDELLGGVMGRMTEGAGGARPQNPLVAIALQLLQQNGGIEGILGKFQQAGYAEQAQSWISTGENRPITADDLQQVLGQGQLGQIARELGLGRREAADGLASMLPQVIDRMTPQGQVAPGSDDLVARALEILNQGRGG